MTLPEKFLENMKELLGEEYSEYVSCMEKESHTALRVNTRKVDPEEFCNKSPFALKEIPWIAKGFYFDVPTELPAKHPFYFAGLYYIQEPSAMIPASILPVEKGDRVLDLCAAPGGKATELAAKLDGTGLLVANDISVSRAMALAKNLQVAGARNAVVTAESPENLSVQFGEYFDKILIDAPCSGEGMFRRDPHMVKDWLERGPEYYAAIQRDILEQAWRMLKPGGRMVYSTCTFSVTEDEGMIQWFLDKHSDMRICPVQRQDGFSPGMPELLECGRAELTECVRIFPHRAQGEGHFAVLLEKAGAVGAPKAQNELEIRQKKSTKMRTEQRGRKTNGKKTVLDEAGTFLEKVQGLDGEIQHQKEKVFLVTEDMYRFVGIRTIFCGLLLGEQKKNRFEPSTQLALALKQEDYPEILDFAQDDIRVTKYLKGETLSADYGGKGYVLVCVEGFPLGWCKGNGQGSFKNKYYPGWRMQ